MSAHFRPEATLLATQNLGRFILCAAAQRVEELGFGWVTSERAPTIYPALLEAFAASEASKVSYPVSGANCEGTVYGTPTANRALRFWHDTRHAQLGLTFAYEDEMLLAVDHLDSFSCSGFDEDSLEYRLFYADTMGQAYFGACGHGFVGDQLRFALGVAAHGLKVGVELEAAAMRAVRDARAA
jgi:hypothetical protein